MNKRVICAILSLLILLSASLPVCGAEAQTPQLTISTAEAFLAFAENCRLDSYSRGLTVSLEANIDLSGLAFESIPVFSGSFKGNGHTVSGLSITAEGSVQGLFRYLTVDATVQELNVQGSVQPGGSKSQIGGIAGSNAGSILDCSFTGTVSGSDSVGGIAGINAVTGMIENCRVEGEVGGSHFVGGIAGENYGVIRNCSNSAQINTTARQNSVELSDITLDTLTNSEAVNTVTDIGGIAGVSSGVIRSCENHGDVGYRHMGYNIGGIAGTQSGYVVACTNHAAVQGRKEVGGIVGQMEPAAVITYSEDTLQILQGQLGTLSSLANRASGNAQTNANQLGSQLGLLRDQAQTAKDAVDAMLPDAEDPELPDADTVLAAQNTLSSSVDAMPGTLNSITVAAQNTAASLNRDMQAIVGQVNAMGQTINGASEDLGGSITDVSDQDTAETLTGKVESCVSYGSVLADMNAGGIAGAVAMENDLDVIEDWQSVGESSLNFQSEVRAVILNCENRGAVTAKKQNAGGIAGWQSMGLVKGCLNTGTLDAAAADYVGGISGLSTGFIRICSTKAEITGSTYVGGIAGSAAVATDCRSMAKLSGTERVGGILGIADEGNTDAEQPIYGNLYVCVDGDPGAVDGISYAAVAEPAALDVFMALENLSESFKTVDITFVFEDGTRSVVSLAPGSALAESDIPDLPRKPGFAGTWDGLDAIDPENILFDMAFHAVYTGHETTLSSTESRNGKPILLVQGDGFANAAVALEKPETEPALADRERLLESWKFTVSGGENITQARLLLPEGADADDLRLYLRSNDGTWRDAQYTVSGSYVVFCVDAADDAVALAEAGGMETLWLLIGAVAALTAVTVLTLVLVRRKRTAKPADKETGEKETLES